ncbi:MAG: PAS domain S-box protein, partial [Thermoplasmata archaeon]|nr:PAS domain S-box protein [Thermoplasmata archaeon]
MAGEKIGVVLGSEAWEAQSSRFPAAAGQVVRITDWGMLERAIRDGVLSMAVVDRELDWSQQWLVARELWERSPQTTVLVVPEGRTAVDLLEQVLSPLHAADVVAAEDEASAGFLVPGAVSPPETTAMPIIARPRLTAPRLLSGGNVTRSMETVLRFMDAIDRPVLVNQLPPDGVPGRFIEVNRSGQDAIGRRRNELLAMRWEELDAGDPEALVRFADALRTRGESDLCTTFIGRDGGRIPLAGRSYVETIDGRQALVTVLMGAVAARDAGAPAAAQAQPAPPVDPEGLLEVTRELQETAERLIEESVSSSQVHERLLAAVARNPIPTVIVLSGGEIASYNDAVLELTGYHGTEVRDLNDWMEKLFPNAARRLRMEQDVRKALDKGQAWIPGVEIARKGGETRTLDLSIAPFEGGLIVQMVDVTERERAEEALRESEERYRALFDRSLEAVYVHDFDGRFLDANSITLEMLGCSRDEIRGMSLDSVIDDGFLPLARRTLEEIAATGRQREISEYMLRRKDGRTVWVETLSSVIKEKGVPVAIQGIARDITDRKRAEEALHESEEKYRSLVERSHDMVFIYQGERFVFTNDRATEVTGYGKGELSGLSLGDLLHGEDREFILDLERRRAAGEGVRNVYEARTVTKMRNVRHCEFSISRITFGGAYAILGAVRDITLRRGTEEALKESEARYRTLIEQSHDAVYIHRGDRFIFANERAREMTGYTRADLLGKGLMDIVHPDDREIVAAAVGGIDQGGRMWEARIVTRDGSVRHCEFSVSPITHGGEAATMGTVRDVTLRRQAEEELRDHRDHLEELVGERTSELRTAYDHLKLEVAERKRVEEELILSKEKYRNLFDNALVGLYRTRISTGEIIECNAQLSRIFGYADRNDFIGKFRSGETYVEPRTRDRLLAKLKVAGKVDNFEARLKRSDGTVFWGSLSAQIYPDEGYIEGFLLDITERKWALEALKESELRYRSLFDNMLNGFAYNKVVEDANGRVVDFVFLEVNDAFQRFVGMGRESIIGRTATEIMPGLEGTEPNLLRAFAEVATTGEQAKFEARIEALDRWFSISAYSPRKGFFVSIYEDVTEAKSAEEALKESEGRFRTLVETMNEGLGVRDENGVIVYVNQRHCDILGRPREEIIGHRVVEFLDGEDRDVMMAQMDRRATGQLGSYEVNFTRKDGQKVPTITSAVPIIDSEGRYRGAFAVILDITDRLKAEGALRESQRALSTLMGNLPGMAYRCANDAHRTMEFVSHGCIDLTGHVPEDLVGNAKVAFADLIHRDHSDRVWAEIQVAMRERRPFQLVYRIRSADGIEKWVWEQGEGVFDDRGGLVAIEGFITDTTERIRAEEELRRRDDILEAVSYSAERFLQTPSWEEGIQEILMRLGSATGISRVCIFENQAGVDGHPRATMHYVWAAAGAAPLSDSGASAITLRDSIFGIWEGPLHRGQLVQTDASRYTGRARAFLTERGVRSLMLAPII